MTREEILLSMFDASGYGLEIGPSYNPLVPRSKGYSVEVLDYADREALVKKYRHTQNVDISKIEFVDHVSDGRPMTEVIGKASCFDFIVASHVVEHTPDLLGFIVDCQKLLEPNGVLVLAVPDKRYCFDFYQPISSTGAVLQAFIEQKTRPTPGAIFDSIAYDVIKQGKIGWPKDDHSPFEFNSSLQEARRVFDIAQTSCDYIDVHVWRFVPSSFRLLIRDLNELSYIDLSEKRFVAGAGHEFYITLSRDNKPPIETRVEMARAVVAEASSPFLESQVAASAQVGDGVGCFSPRDIE